MVAVTLNQKLLDADLSGLFSPDVVLVGIELPEITADPDLIPKRTGTTLTITNPTFSGGAVKWTGTITATFSSAAADASPVSLVVALSSISATTPAGVLTLNGNISSTENYTTNKYSLNLTFNQVTFIGADGSSWSFSGSFVESASDTNPDGTSTGTLNSFKVTKGSDTLTYSGSIKINADDTYSGDITSITGTLAGTPISLTGLQIPADKFFDISLQGGVNSFLPDLLGGNDTITLSGPINRIAQGLGGNDVINGSTAIDSIDGGSGADTINAGAGDDLIYAGLGDVIDGGAGNDTVNLSAVGSFNWLDRSSSSYTVTGTAAALVFTDNANKTQPIRFNNVEQFDIGGGQLISAARMLNPNSMDLTGNDLLSSAGPGLGANGLLDRIFVLTGEVDIGSFTKDDFNQIVNYDSSSGTYNFAFKAANNPASTFNFSQSINYKEPNYNRSTTYVLTDTSAGLSLTAGENYSGTNTSSASGKYTFSSNGGDNFAFKDTNATSTTVDDIVISSTYTQTYSGNSTPGVGGSFLRKSSGSLGYSNSGRTLSVSQNSSIAGTWGPNFDYLSYTDTLTISGYSLAYKNIDTTQTADNFSLSFNGSVNYKFDVATKQSLTFTVTNLSLEDSVGKLTTAKAVFDFSNKTNSDSVSTGSVVELASVLIQNNETRTVEYAQKAKIEALLGFYDDGETATDSIVDAVNVYTMKLADDAFMGAGADTVTGSAFNDTIDGGAGADVLSMGAGDDLIFAGLGDVIDGGAGTDTVDLSELLDANGKALTYDLYNRSGVYTVSGTPTALVLTDVASKQTITVNNVEKFLINGTEVSSATFLSPNSQARTGNELLRGIGTSDPNISANSALALGYRHVLSPQRVPFANEIDLSFFEGVDFSGTNNTKTYDPDKGTFNFTFTNGSGSNLSTFTFAETTVPNAGSGGSRTTTYGLSNAAEGVTFTGMQSNVDTSSVKNGVYSGTYKSERGFTFTDTQGTTKTTADDLIIGFKTNDTGSWSSSNTALSQQGTGSWATNYAQQGLTVASSGTYKDSMTSAFYGGEKSAHTDTSTYTNYKLAYTNPDTTKTADNFSISFSGALAYDLVGTSLDKTATGPRQIFTITNYSGEDAFGKLTTAKATLDLSKSIDPNTPNTAVWLKLHQSSAGKVDSELIGQVESFLGFFNDGETSTDSIWDAANVLTLKQATYAYTGAQADTITGSTGNDTIDGATGADAVIAGKGDDLIYAGLGDVIDGSEGIDTVDLSKLVKADGSSYNFFDRSNGSGYTVTGTAAALVFTDTSNKSQPVTVKFNNVEQFKLGDQTFSAGRMLNTSSMDVTGDELLWGGGGIPYWGITSVLDVSLLTGEVNLDLFKGEQFNTVQNYDRNAGIYSFVFSSKQINSGLSTFKFNQTGEIYKNQTVSYELANLTEGISFSGSRSMAQTEGALTNGSRPYTWNTSQNFVYTNKNGTSSTNDDLIITVKSGSNLNGKLVERGLPTYQYTDTFVLTYSNLGLNLAVSGIDSTTVSDIGGEQRVSLQTTKFSNYLLEYKNPDASGTGKNFSLSFSGIISYDYINTKDLSRPSQIFTINNFILEDAVGKLTTTKAVLDFSKDIQSGNPLLQPNSAAKLALIQDNETRTVEYAQKAKIEALLGFYDDGETATDSIVDAVNVYTMKLADDAFMGAGADTVTGSAFNDTIDGGTGADVLSMGAGDDLVFAGLGDVIDGGAGTDTVDLSELLDANGKALTYDLYQRNGVYTVTGTPTALVLTDVASKQTITVNNVEKFLINGTEVSAATMLAPNSQSRTGNELLWGIGDSNPNISPDSPLAMGVDFSLEMMPLTSHVDLSFFKTDDFSGTNNTKTYDPDKGTYNFSFTSNAANKAVSTFTFAETTVPDAGSGGSRTTTYGLSNATEGLTFTGSQGVVETFNVKNNVYSGTYKIDRSYAFADTQGTTKTTADDLLVGFKSNDTGSWSSNQTAYSHQGTGSWTTNYSQLGLTLNSSGTYKESYTAAFFGAERSSHTITTTYTNYTLAYKDPDTTKTADNFSISFGGSTAYDLLGTSVDKTANGARQVFSITNFSSEDSYGKLTTAKAMLDLSKSIDQIDPNLEVWLRLHQSAAGKADEALVDQVVSFFGLFDDGETSADSIWDAANVLTLKQATYAHSGAQADTITGSVGKDTIDGGTGADSVIAGKGDDLIYAGLGDVIDGSEGIDTVDLSTLVKADGSTYNFFDRSAGSGYTVTGTAAALVFTDTSNKSQPVTVKFNNVEQFKLGDQTFSAGRMLTPTSIDVTGDELLWGAGSTKEGLSPNSPLAKGVDYLLTEPNPSLAMYGEADLQFLKDAKFATLQNYNPNAGVFSFTFKSDADTDRTSVFKFTETAVAQTATGESRATSYEIVNTDLGISFKGARNFSDSYTTTKGVTTGTRTFDTSFTYTNTQATKAIADDVSVSSKTTGTAKFTDSQTIPSVIVNATFAVGYSNGKTGWSVSSKGTLTDSQTVASGQPLNTLVADISAYTATYKNPDPASTVGPASVSFTGKLEAQDHGTTQTQIFTVKNFKADSDLATITTALAKIDLSSNKYFGDDVILGMVQGEDGKVGESVQAYLDTLFGLQDNGDGVLPFDSILDAANVVVMKRAGDGDLGAGNDTYTGSSGDDTITGGAGADVLNMGAGNDLIYAGLGDVIDGGVGTDTADLSRLLGANGQALTYSLFDRQGKYTVSGTPAALVLTDIASKQTIKFNNVENFIIGGVEVSAQELINPYKVSGDDLLWGIGSNPNLDDFSYLVMGLERIFHEADSKEPVYPFYGDIDLEFFRGDAFTQAVFYNPYEGVHKFSFTSSTANGSPSTFTFNETTVPNLGNGGSQTTSFGLTNTKAGINFTGASSGSSTITAIKGGKSVVNKGEITYTYSDTQGNASTADDIALTFKIGGGGTETYSASGYNELTNGTFSINYANFGWGLVANGTFKDTQVIDANSVLTTDKSVITIANYTFSYKNPLTGGDLSKNFKISFNGSIDEDYIGTGTASSPNTTQILTLTNLSMDFAGASITTAKAVVDLSDRFEDALILNTFSNSEGRVDESIVDYLSYLFGLDDNADGADPNDSILDAANVVTMKVAGSGFMGAGNDTVIGSAGNDEIDGGTGADSITAGKGDDLIYAGLGDFIDGGEGIDTVDLGTLSRPGGGTYDFFTRNSDSGYTVTGTTAALVFTDTATKQAVKFNNVERFKLGDQTFSAGRMLDPSSFDISGGNLLKGTLSIPNHPRMAVMERSTATGIDGLLDEISLLTGDVDLDLFLQADFAQVVNYNPAAGAHTFKFTSTPVDNVVSTFNFKETSTAYTDKGGSRSTAYELNNTSAGIKFTGDINYADTFSSTANGSTPFSWTGSKSVTYTDTQATTSTLDDVIISVKFTEAGTGSLITSGGGKFQDSGTFAFNYVKDGMTLVSTGSFTGSGTTGADGQPTARTETITLGSYSLSQKITDSADNFSLSFAGSLAYDLLGKSLDPTATDPRMVFTVSNMVFEDQSSKLTTAAAKLDLSSSISDTSDAAIPILLKLLQNDTGSVDRSVLENVGAIFGIDNDGSSSFDSIWDAANGYTIKVAGSVATGGGNDTITGSNNGADSIDAGSGADLVNAGAGDDFIFGGDGADVLNGDAGNDAIDGGTGADNISGGAGNDSLMGGLGNDTIVGGDGDDGISGGAGDVITGGNGNDTWVIDYDEIGSITGVTGSMAALTIAGKRVSDGSNFSITANAVEVVLVGGVSYTNFNELKAALLPP